MKTKLFAGLITVGLILTLDFTFGTLLRHFYFSEIAGLHHRITYAMDSTKADILLMGSSRCNHHYNPLIFEKELKLSTFNAGCDGQGLPYHYCILQSALKRYSPKYVILDLSLTDLHRGTSWERLSTLLPYYQHHPEIQNIIDQIGPYERIKLLSKIYPYNSSLITIAVGNMDFNKKRAASIKGYIPLHKVWNRPRKAYREKHGGLDTRNITILERFIQDCRQRDVKLFIIVSPAYYSAYPVASLKRAREIISRYQVPLIDYSSSDVFLKRKEFFADELHLNDRGAPYFSEQVAKQIKQFTNPDVTARSSERLVRGL